LFTGNSLLSLWIKNKGKGFSKKGGEFDEEKFPQVQTLSPKFNLLPILQKLSPIFYFYISTLSNQRSDIFVIKREG